MSSGKVKCTCGHSWNKSDSSQKDMHVCHACGKSDVNMKNGGWLDSYADGGTMQEHQENYNDYEVSAPEGFQGEGYSNVGRNYSPAWGGQFQTGGEIPMAQKGLQLPSVQSLIADTKKRKNQPKDKEINNTKKDNTKTITPKLGKQLTPEQIEQRRVQQLIDKQGTITASTPQSTSSRLKEIALNPLTAFGYAARNENLPENFSRGERNTLDMATDIINPAFYINQANNAGNNINSSVSNIIQGNLPSAYRDIKNAGMNIVNALPLISEYEALGKVTGELGQLSKQGLREGVDLVHPVGKALRQIEREGALAGLSPQEIKKLQLEKVGITSAQREGYFPGVSEIATEYITPYSYDNAAARIKDIPRRIIKGEKNSKNLVDVDADFILNHEAKNLVSKPRYDAWRMYSGLPQKNNTFRIAETTPIDHPSYFPEQLNNLEKFSLNNESKLLNSLPQKNDLAHLHYGDPEDLVKALPDLKSELEKIQNIKNKGIDTSLSDFTQTNVMGGYNRRFFDNKMEYNDIWDLDLKGNKVEKYFGKPFLSHGQLDYSFQPAEEELNNLIRQGEYHEKNVNPYIKSPLKEFYLDPKHLNQYNQLNPKDILINKKPKKDGGIIKDDRGQWDHPGEITEIGSNQITMKGVPYPVLGISDTGDTQMMYPEEEYEFDGEKVTEFPMAKNGIRQEQKGLVNLNQLTNFTNYNKPQPGGWLNKYN
jgi:hypothetical protein